MTAGQIITAVLNNYVNAGGRSATRAALRSKARFHLNALLKKAENSYPWARKYILSSSVSVTSGSGDLPSDFGSIGPNGKVFISGGRKELRPLTLDRLVQLIQLNPSTSDPLRYCIEGYNATTGRSTIKTYPTGTASLVICNYLRKAPTAIDFPTEPTVVVGAAGALTGSRQYLLTYATADGETEAGFPSTAVTLASQKANLYNIPVPDDPAVTHRYLYRTAAGGSTFFRHSELDLVTAYTSAAPLVDNTADGSLGIATPPLPAAAITGVEKFPEDWHSTLLYDGLVARMMQSQGDMREGQMDGQFVRDLRAAWVFERADQNRIRRTPPFGASRLRL